MTMHPSLATIPTPPHLAPWVPSSRRDHSAVRRFELGQIAPESGTPVVYQPLPEGLTGDGLPHSLERRACPDCPESYQPKAWNQERCPPCGRAYRLAQATARKTTARTRRSEPRVRSPAAEKGLATKAIDKATRERARREHDARARSAA